MISARPTDAALDAVADEKDPAVEAFHGPARADEREAAVACAIRDLA